MNEKKQTILVVDDELSIRESFALILSESYNLLLVASGEAALKTIADSKVDLVFLDIRMPGLDGIEALKRIKEIDKDSKVVMVTAVNDVQKASETVKLGAQDYVVKPFDVDTILSMCERILAKAILEREAKEAREKAKVKVKPIEVIGQTFKVKEVEEIINRVSKKDTPLLIEGEIGIEAEYIATLIHELSERRLKPFIRFNGRDVSEEVLKSSLFGRGGGIGVFTLKKEKGALELAHEGTLFLNNIELLPPGLQASLKEVILKKEFKREGSISPISIDVRIIAYSGALLKELVKEGVFDKELYELLSETIISLPPLRERSTDIPFFISYYVDKFNDKYNKSIKGFTKEALDILSGYSWPGNVLELETILERLISIKDADYIGVGDLPFDIILNSSTPLLGDEIRELNLEGIYSKFEKELMLRLFKKYGSDIRKIAKILGLQPPALSVKLNTLGIKEVG